MAELRNDPLEPNTLQLHWKDYAAKFAADLGFSGEEDYQSWGSRFSDPLRLLEYSQYFLDNSEFSRVGREMLLELIFCSAHRALDQRPLSDKEDAILRRVVDQAISNKFDRDVVRNHWEFPPQDPFSEWLLCAFPEWRPARSVWDTGPTP
jgi:hypothetical protein